MSPSRHDVIFGLLVAVGFGAIYVWLEWDFPPAVCVPVAIGGFLAAGAFRLLFRARCPKCRATMKRRTTRDHDDKYVEYYCFRCNFAEHRGPIDDG